MNTTLKLLLCSLTLILNLAFIHTSASTEDPPQHTRVRYKQFPEAKLSELKNQPDGYWKERMTKEQYAVMREKSTEKAFSGKYSEFFEPGTYVCAACGLPLYSADTKFSSGTGWPSFYKPIDDKAVECFVDKVLFITRLEVRCSRCGSHLGHVFDDGPAPTHQRYCMNSIALKFLPSAKSKKGK